MQSTPPQHNEDLSDWLQEAGKRRISQFQSGHVEVPALPTQMEIPVESEPPRPAARRPAGRWLAFSAVAAVAYMQFFYADVLLQIAKAPAIIFFVLVNGQLPPL